MIVGRWCQSCGCVLMSFNQEMCPTCIMKIKNEKSNIDQEKKKRKHEKMKDSFFEHEEIDSGPCYDIIREISTETTS